MIGRARRLRLRRDEDGAVLVEFAIALPLLLLVMAAFVDFGALIYLKLRLDESVSAASNYAIMNHARLSEFGPGPFAAELAGLLAASTAGASNTYRVAINNNVEVRVADEVTEEVALGGDLEGCYCPTRSGSGISLGDAVSCGQLCAGGTLSARFITIEASRNYTPLFTSYGLSDGEAVRAAAIVPILR